MAHDHRGRRVGRPWMHDVEGMRKAVREGSRGAMRANDSREEGYVDPEDLMGFHYVNLSDED